MHIVNSICKFLVILFLTSCYINIYAQPCSEPSVSGTTYSTIADGNWSNSSVWLNGSVPPSNIGNNNKIIINHTIDRNYSSDFKPSSNSVLIIKNGGALTTEQIQLESSSRIIINTGKLHVDHGNFQVLTSAASVCAYQACIIIDENFQFQSSGTNMTFHYTGIQVDNGNLQSNANVTGSQIRIWLKNGNLERNGGTWPVSSISHRRVSGNVVGFSGIVPQSSPSEIALQISPCDDPDLILPVKLVSFEASRSANISILKWETASENNNKGFEIEHSFDGRNWHNNGTISSKSETGSSNSLLKYIAIDHSPEQGNNYYRLKQMDFDGNSTYSPIEIVQFDKISNITILPNPVQNELQVFGLTGTGNNISITNISGQSLINAKAYDNSGINIDISGLPKGIYFIKISNEMGNTNIHKIIKE